MATRGVSKWSLSDGGVGLAGVAEWIATGPLAFALRPSYQALELQLWKARGRTGLLPHKGKQQVVKEYGRQFQLGVLVETGTYLGDMIWAVRRNFREIHSIELDPDLHVRAAARFGRQGHVHLYQGDSGLVLGQIVARLEEPALFWLDGHFSGGITARADTDTPVLDELKHVFGDRRHPHLALIDDAGEFLTNDRYPSLKELESRVAEIDPELTMAVADNVIRVHRPQASTLPN